MIKKANQFVAFKFGDVQLLDNLNFLGGATSLDFFLESLQHFRDERVFFL